MRIYAPCPSALPSDTNPLTFSGHQRDLRTGWSSEQPWHETAHAERFLQTVYNAIKEGYRLFDAALDYGNEKEAGEGLARAIKDGLVKREDICE